MPQLETQPPPTSTKKSRQPRRVWVQNVDVNVKLLLARLDSLSARRAVVRRRQLESGRRRTRRIAELERRLAAEDAIDARARRLLDEAHAAAHRHNPAPNRVMNWWGGRLIEAAYQNLHAAEALIAQLYDWDQLEAEIPEAVARIEAGLHRDDPRRDAAIILAGVNRSTTSLGTARAAVTKAIEVGHAAADREHTRIRSFRNAVLASGLLIFVLMAGFATYVWCNDGNVPLCFTPFGTEGPDARWVCPTGEYAAGVDPTRPHDVVVVLLLGVLGGGLAAAIAIKGLTGTSTPYDVPLALAALKLPLGALTALGALIALQGDFVPGLSELDSQGQILAYALVFGYAQQLLSGLLDRKAQALLDSAPGKDKDAQYTRQRVRPPAGSQLPLRGTATGLADRVRDSLPA